MMSSVHRLKETKYKHTTNEAFQIICTKEDNHISQAICTHLTQQMLQCIEVATCPPCIVESEFLH